MKCPRCGRENEEDKAVCYFCYAPLTGPGREAHERGVHQPPRRRRSLLVGRILPIVIVLAVGGGTASWFLLRVPNTPEGVALAYLEAQMKDDWEAMSSLVTEKNRQEYEEQQQLRERRDEMLRAHGIDVEDEEEEWKKMTAEHKVESVSVQGDRATVKVRRLLKVDLEGKSRLTPLAMRLVVMKEDGTWKVDPDATKTERIPDT